MFKIKLKFICRIRSMANPSQFSLASRLAPSGLPTYSTPAPTSTQPKPLDLTHLGLHLQAQAQPRPQISSASLLGPVPTIPPRNATIPTFTPSSIVSRPQTQLTTQINLTKNDDGAPTQRISSAALLSQPVPPPSQSAGNTEQQRKRKLEEYQREHNESDTDQQTRMRMTKAIRTDEGKVGRPDWTTPFTSFDDVLTSLSLCHYIRVVISFV